MRDIIRPIARFFSVPTDNPELLKAQYRAFSRQMPMMYLILMLSTWALAITHMDEGAPVWLTIGIPLLFTLVSALRIRRWWKSRHIEPTAEIAAGALRRTNRLAPGIAISFTLWSFLLFPYGNAYAQSHVAFYMAITVITCIFCLMHLRSAAMIVAVIVNGAFVTFFALTGHAVFMATAVNIILVSAGMLVILGINYRDFTRMVNARTESLRKEREQSRLLHMIDDMPVAVMTVEPDTLKINYANETSKQLIRNIEHLLPLKADDLLGTCIDIFHRHPEHQRGILADPANLPHNARIKLGPEVLDLKVSAVRDNDGSYIGPMLTWALVTKEIEAENRILQLAHYDTLTGLANRNTFQEQLAARLAAPEGRIGLLFLDLDGFKLVNDTRGHRAGDMLLKQVAERLQAICTGPSMSISRLGGDEFAVVAPYEDPDQAVTLGNAIIGALSAPYHLENDWQAQIGVSIGLSLAPEHGDDAETLLSRADIALYSAKAAGKGTLRLFQHDMECRIHERVRLEAKLRGALDGNDGLFVFYQPIVDIHTGKTTAREALVRWHHPQRGWISPGEFVPVAEQCGLIDRLGGFVLQSACREAATWRDGARVAVNVSAGQLGKGTLAPAVLAALVESGLEPGRLEIEVTETALLTEEADAIGDLRRIRDMGVRVALDDFGTGYSSLAHLRAFPFDKIKIDGSFVRDAVDRPDCAAVVRAIAELGKRLGVTTVAEGVETQAHLDRVREEGCSEVQGYFFSRPMPSERDAPLIERLNAALRDERASSR
ncbi:EAL domain-containing protein [Rhizobiaceae bacterium BDR2-2]|uniref:EAL domain-containing protein n=1 Tax=Ectorhizobium quercum TaxID=2965071 RepID=A0AAE3STR2_9HYPH|nr:EAL domain-containing protein [Ectorhizobium quercum]MCX8996217.1 EAL domain-containing protein [Ectorhizobium quercum]MCX8998744.1 EAL domain-containing protein [Ectorhizobium quercum]